MVEKDYIEPNKYNRENAKKELKAGNYLCAKNMFEQLWESSSKDDLFLLFDYGLALRKVEESKKFIEICRELNENKKIMSNTYIISILCWCLYDCYIKNYNAEDKDNFCDFLKKAEFIKDNCEQKDATEYYKTPYFLVIKKVVKIYNERASKNYKEIIKWLSYLDPDRLSEEVYNFQDEKGKERELASPKEFYYQNMIKALEKTEQYEKCILMCEIALKQIKKLHYRNNTWIKARLYFSNCMVKENIDSAIDEYKKLAYKENYWFMYHKLSQICFRYNRTKDSLLYASKAFECRFEYEKMVNLMLDTALLWQANGNQENAKIFFHASAYYRERQHWSMPEELLYAVSVFEIDVKVMPNVKVLQEISENYIDSIEGHNRRYKGRVLKILHHGGAGFIQPLNGDKNIYFNKKEVLGRKAISIGSIVEYDLSKDKSNRAIAVRINIRS